MGLPKFYGSWLSQKRFKKLYAYNPQQINSSISFDFNGAVHEERAYVCNEGEFFNRNRVASVEARSSTEAGILSMEIEIFQRVCDRLDKAIIKFKPQECVVIAFDGVAPCAKMQHQQQRRVKAALSTNKQIIDGNAISPGTDFMIRLDDYVQGWINSKMKSGFAAKEGEGASFPTNEAGQAERIWPKKIIFTGQSVPGEGEHKIMELFRAGQISGDNAHIIVGMDADLTILCLANGTPKLQVVRNIDWLDTEGVIPIDELKEAILQELGSDRIEDFVALTLLIGNDFLPALCPLLVIPDNMTALINAYRKRTPRLIIEGVLQIEGLALLLEDLMENTQPLYGSLKQFVENPVAGDTYIVNSSVGDLITTTIQYDLFWETWYQQWGLNAGEVATKIEPELRSFISALPPILIDNIGTAQSWIPDICADYLETLHFIVGYYFLGEASVNPNLMYPHFWSPLLEDFSAYCSTLPVATRYAERETPLGVLHQMLAILPKASHNLLPKFLLPLTQVRLADMYPDKVEINISGTWPDKRNPHRLPDKAIALLPYFNPYRLKAALASVSPTAKERAPYAVGEIQISSQDSPSLTLERSLEAIQKFKREANRNRNPRGRGFPPRGGQTESAPRGGYGRGERGERSRGRGERGRGRGERGRGERSRGRGERGRGGQRISLPVGLSVPVIASGSGGSPIPSLRPS